MLSLRLYWHFLSLVDNSSVRMHQRRGSARFWTAPGSHSVLSDSFVHIDVVVPHYARISKMTTWLISILISLFVATSQGADFHIRLNQVKRVSRKAKAAKNSKTVRLLCLCSCYHWLVFHSFLLRICFVRCATKQAISTVRGRTYTYLKTQ